MDIRCAAINKLLEWNQGCNLPVRRERVQSAWPELKPCRSSNGVPKTLNAQMTAHLAQMQWKFDIWEFM